MDGKQWFPAASALGPPPVGGVQRVSWFCNLIKLKANLSIRDIARKMGYQAGHAEVQRILKMGPKSNITLKTLFRFAEVCGYDCYVSFIPKVVASEEKEE